MTPRERAACALSLGVPDRVPTFELEFQLAQEFMGRPFLTQKDIDPLPEAEREKAVKDNAEYMIRVYQALEHDIIPVHYFEEKYMLMTARHIRAVSGDTYMLTAHGDGTFAIPDGAGMEKFIFDIADRPEEVHETARRMADDAIARNLRYIDAGFDSFILCSDYCFNQGPFLSPRMFAQFVTPYLEKICRKTKEAGAFVIKHTDGDIMPIIDQLVDAGPHALHSLDPMAGVDIRAVKEQYGHRVALCGNVHCAAMQTGTEQEVVDSCEYCLTYAKPGGGYVFATSNIPFRGLPLERYMLVLDQWKKHRDYDGNDGALPRTPPGA